MLFKRVDTYDDAEISLLIIYPEEIIGQVQKAVWIRRIFIIQNVRNWISLNIPQQQIG